MCLLRNTSRVGNIRNAPPVDCALTTPLCSAVGLLQRIARLFPARLSSAADQWSTLSRCDRSASNWRDPERSTACESQIVNIKNTVSFPVSITALPQAVRFPSSLTRTATVWTTFDNWVRRPRSFGPPATTASFGGGKAPKSSAWMLPRPGSGHGARQGFSLTPADQPRGLCRLTPD
jgi:hypothetical protein